MAIGHTATRSRWRQRESRAAIVGEQSSLRVRALDSGETAVVRSILAGMSGASRSSRFGSPMPRISDSLCRNLLGAGTPDAVTLIAEAGRHDRIEPIGFAQLIPTSTCAAEVSVAVADAHRRTGVAHALLSETVREAQRRNWTRLEASVLAANEPALSVVASLTDAGSVDALIWCRRHLLAVAGTPNIHLALNVDGEEW
ncbi:GNAT family N-acetyltransferase [Antrihabitans sp. YC3-6]|uniref:GNAT family N-acetyltransferase n=1 Tax=Antrihabitans stalagmiti TaxID=2799499 RepID=A0A934NMU4_9NOCA|nr:GNAT family N-acetyltransferase [Antrihabitans stalagmiti]MBJ8338082.1 GNAT family N-acetyltransferase [Antrihabitans stalagmiti]